MSWLRVMLGAAHALGHLTGSFLQGHSDLAAPSQRGNREWKSAFGARVCGADGWAGKLPGTRFLSSSIAAVPVTAQPASALGH